MTVAAATLAVHLAVASLGHPDHARREAAEGWCRATLAQPHPLLVRAYHGPDPEASRRAARLLWPWPRRAAYFRRPLLDAAVCLYWPVPRFSATRACEHEPGWRGCDVGQPPQWLVDLALRPEVAAGVRALADVAGALSPAEGYYWDAPGRDRETAAGCLYVLRHRATGRVTPADRSTRWWFDRAELPARGAVLGGAAAVVSNPFESQL